MVAARLRSDRDLHWLLSVAPSWFSQGIPSESFVDQSRCRVYLVGGVVRDVGGRVHVFAAIAIFWAFVGLAFIGLYGRYCVIFYFRKWNFLQS